MPRKPATPKPAAPSPANLAAAVHAMADFIAAMPTQPSPAEERRQAALAAARSIGWKG